MIVQDIVVEEHRKGAALSATLVIEQNRPQRFRLQYVVRGGQPEWLWPAGNAFLAAVLMPAMALGETVTVEAPVSPRLLKSLPTIMAIYRQFDRTLRPVEIVAPQALSAPAAGGVGLFFSGGVDSFYSLLKNQDVSVASPEEAVSHLLLVFGFDVKLDNPALFEQIVGRIGEVARVTGKHLVIVQTNVRTFSDPLVAWDLYHGGPIASVALALAGLFRRCLVASTYAYGELHPWGSHPLVDPLWSTETLDVIHDGCEVYRSEKIKRLSASPLALSTLRACWNNGQSRYNCGRCEKCLRTMMGLHIAGALEHCSTFDDALTPATLRRLRTGSESGALFLEDLLQACGSSPRDEAIKAAIRRAIRRMRWRHAAGRLARRYVGEWATLATLKKVTAPFRAVRST